MVLHFCGCVLGCGEVEDPVADPGKVLFQCRIWGFEFLGILIEFNLCLGVCRFGFVEISGEGGQ